MKAKEFLKQYEELNRIAEQHRQEYQLELEKIDAVGSTLSGEPGMPYGTGISRKTEDKAIKLADKAAQWRMAELDAIEKRQEVYELISKVKGIEGEILYQRYINLRTWEEICVAIHYTWSSTHRAHRRALAIVQSRLDNDIERH